ncbi:unnamed protein product [Microthlaspi erraticum]|uniref:Protein kinase domain-containing protein n=2 Tax=Coluteocarpeae TaxID=1394505 RepID=A0A6D2L3E1_9BRAS|nr:unnamed protein product [Microthlaspi erraticum]CAA7054520.1 unnamed protein product [Microthlaspi erraticum]
MVGCESTCTTSNNSQSIPFFDKVGCSTYRQITTWMLPTNYVPVCNTTKKEEDTICNGKGCCQVKAPEGGQQLIGITIANISNGNLTTGGDCKVAFLTDEDYTLLNGCRGNPYVVDKCIEINECLDNPCGSDKTCKDTPEGYECKSRHIPEILTGLGTGITVLALVGGTWWLRKFLKKKRTTKRKRKFFKRNGGLLLQQQLHTTQGNVEKTKIFTSRELEKATENFSVNRIVGQGGQGTVYKGMLVDGRSVAVKKSNVVDEDKLQEFINEVMILSQINHRHVVKLLGCCLETEVPVLVYEFITNGNLFQHLHEEFDDYTVLWGVRMRIAVDIAAAFSYLHSAASSPIYHRDIKSTNILLDEKYRAKVSDFGTSRSVTIDHTHWTTVISGTVGYVDPEYYGSSHFTEKSDVYSFGVVLVELITGEKPVITLLNTQEITGLADYFRLAMKENRLFEIIDARIRNDCKLEQVIAVANLAMRCLKKTGKSRPDMREVSTALQRICSSLEDFLVQIQIDGDEKLHRGDSWSTVAARTV